MPEGAVYVGRPTKWGNPFPINDDGAVWRALACGYLGDAAGRRLAAVALHRAWLTGSPIESGGAGSEDGGALQFADGSTVSIDDHCRGIAAVAAGLMGKLDLPERPDLTELRGRDLVCWCPLDAPCHADTLLAIANPAAPTESNPT